MGTRGRQMVPMPSPPSWATGITSVTGGDHTSSLLEPEPRLLGVGGT